MRATRAFVVRTLRATRLLAIDGRIPKPLRWLAVPGLLPIPGPLDEMILLLLAPILFVFHRQSMRDAWLEAGARGDDVAARPTAD